MGGRERGREGYGRIKKRDKGREGREREREREGEGEREGERERGDKGREGRVRERECVIPVHLWCWSRHYVQASHQSNRPTHTATRDIHVKQGKNKDLSSLWWEKRGVQQCMYNSRI